MTLATNRVVLLRYTGDDGQPRRGSGLRIGGALVLTADHCARGRDHWVVVAGKEYRAKEAWRSGSENVDVALLRANDLPNLEPLTYALINTETFAEIEHCVALGFPTWSPSMRRVQVNGYVPTGEGGGAYATDEEPETLAFKITTPAIRDRQVEAGDQDKETSPWGGISGAVIVTRDDQILGVIRGHVRAAGVGSLTFTPLAAIETLTAEKVAEFWALLGVEDQHALSVLPAPQQGPVAPSVARDLQQINLPPRPVNFVGRTEELNSITNAAGTVVITGVGGGGKTSLAAEYAYQRFSDDHSIDFVWWFNAANRMDLTAAMSAVYSALTENNQARDAELGAAQLRNWLERSPHSWLIVFDNADESDIEQLITQSNSGRMIITSRNSIIWPSTLTMLTIKPLPDSDAQLLMERTTGLPSGPNDHELITELDGLPLLIVQAGTLMHRINWSAEQYLTELRARPTALYARNLSAPDKTAARVIDTSVQQAERAPGGEMAVDVFGVLAYLAADNISVALLDQPIGQDLIGETLERTLAISALCEFSLATKNASSIRVLPVIQRLIRLRVERVGENGATSAGDGESENLDSIYPHAALAANLVTVLGAEILTRTPGASAPGEESHRAELLAWYPHYTTIRDHLKRIEDAQTLGRLAFGAAIKLSQLASPVNQVLGEVGRVKWFNAQKGFGFIEPSSQDADVFVHISAVERRGLTALKPGQLLSFRIVQEKGRRSVSAILVAPDDSQ